MQIRKATAATPTAPLQVPTPSLGSGEEAGTEDARDERPAMAKQP